MALLRTKSVVLERILMFAALTSSVVCAGSEKGTWGLKQILERAAQTSTLVKASERDSVSAQNQAYQAGRWDNPQVSANLGQRTVGDASGKTYQVTVLQSIPIFGQKSATEDAATQQFLVSQSQTEIEKLLFHHEVVKRAYRLASTDEQLKHIAHRREKMELIGEYLNNRPFASPSQAVERNLIQNRLREVEEQFAKLSSDREQEWQSLNLFLDLKEPIRPEIEWFTQLNIPGRAQLLEKVSNKNPELTKQSKVVSAAEMSIAQMGKRAYPDISVGGGYSEAGGDAPEKTYFGTVQLSIPLFDGGGYGKAAAVAKHEAETYRMEYRRREILSEFAKAWSELIESKRRIEIYPVALIPRLEREMRQAEANWKKGLVTVSAFLEIENQVHGQAVKVFDAQLAYIEALSQLLFSSGEVFPAEGK